MLFSCSFFTTALGSLLCFPIQENTTREVYKCIKIYNNLCWSWEHVLTHNFNGFRIFYIRVFVFVVRKRRPFLSKKNCLLFNENFTADIPYLLFESFLLDTLDINYLFAETQDHFLYNTVHRARSYCHAILAYQRQQAFDLCLPILFPYSSGGISGLW